MRLIVGVCTAVISSWALAADNPEIGRLSPKAASNGIVGLQYNCELVQTARDGAHLDCDFTRISIEPPDKSRMPVDIDEYIDSEIKKLSPQELEESLAEMRDSSPVVCSELKKSDPIEKATKKAGRPNERGVEILHEVFSEFERINCEDNELTTEDIKRFMKTSLKIEMNTCSLSIFEYSKSFKPSDRNTWASNLGPMGPCGTIEVFSFSSDPSSQVLPSLRLWEYTERTIRTKQEDEYCKQAESEEVVEYGWMNTGKAVPASCVWIEFE